jgi:hypothetical protein
MAKPVQERQERKPIDRKQTVNYLCRAFDSAAEVLGPRSKAVRGNDLYDAQVTMAYLVDEIERGPEASARHAMAKAYRLIDTLNEEKGA